MSEKVMTLAELRDEIAHRWKDAGHETRDYRLYHSMLCALDDLDAAQQYLGAMIDDMERWARGAPGVGDA